MKTVGIDIGTTSICGVVLDGENGNVLRTVSVNSDAFIPTQNSFEKIQNVEKIIKIATEMLDAFLAEFGTEITAIGITGQMHGIVYTDKEGHAVSPLCTWQDERGNLPYKDTTYAKYLNSFTGYGNVTDFYNRENGLVPEGAVAYCTVHDYFGMCLCKNSAPIIHTSDAASFGLYDVEKQKFLCDFRSRITDGFEIIGEYRHVPVAVAIGDNQASVFSTLADADDVLLNIGTGSQVSVVTDKPLLRDGVECRPYVGGKYLLVGAALCGGRAYSLLKDFYAKLLELADAGKADVYGLMDKMIVGVEHSTLKVDTRFAGTRNDASVKGGISGITVNNLTPSELTMGVLEGMIDELYGMYLTFGVKTRGIVGSGNGVRKNKALARIAEKRFDGKLRMPVYTEEAACGAALFALVACGAYENMSQVQGLIRYID